MTMKTITTIKGVIKVNLFRSYGTIQITNIYSLPRHLYLYIKIFVTGNRLPHKRKFADIWSGSYTSVDLDSSSDISDAVIYCSTFDTSRFTWNW